MSLNEAWDRLSIPSCEFPGEEIVELDCTREDRGMAKEKDKGGNKENEDLARAGNELEWLDDFLDTLHDNMMRKRMSPTLAEALKKNKKKRKLSWSSPVVTKYGSRGPSPQSEMRSLKGESAGTSGEDAENRMEEAAGVESGKDRDSISDQSGAVEKSVRGESQEKEVGLPESVQMEHSGQNSDVEMHNVGLCGRESVTPEKVDGVLELISMGGSADATQNNEVCLLSDQ